ncbi:MAG: sugar phosphate isomerase/epimerase [Verrucomicrobiae bacterium]|nr:sugar phosphate isomerase/epimerase [Verrucomicrobiae bacterium]
MPRPFPLAIITDEVSQELDKVLAFARDFRLDGLEIRSMFGRAFKDLTPTDLKQIRSRADASGLKLPCCASPVFKCEADQPAQVREHIDIFKRSLDAAHALGSGLVRVFAFLRKNTPSTRDDLRHAADHFPPLIELARQAKVAIGLENEYTTMVASGAETRDFLAQLGDPSVGVVWDPCNIVFMPGSGDVVKDDYPRVAGRVIHYHVKDAKKEGGREPQHCVELGQGQVDHPAQIAALKKEGFEGWISLETHWRQKALSAEEQHLPAGYAFSANGEPASRVCMAHLARWLDQA